MKLPQIDIEYLERLTKLASHDGTAILISVFFIFYVISFLNHQFKKIDKRLCDIYKNTKGYIQGVTLLGIYEIFISDIRNAVEKYIYDKIENNNLKNYYEGYIENDIVNIESTQINEKREVLITLTTYNNVNQFRNITEKRLKFHINNIKLVFLDELKKVSINYENLRNITKREMELFEKETINDLKLIF